MVVEAGRARLRRFLAETARLVGEAPGEAALLERGRALLADLVAEDDWLPEECAVPHPQHYQQYLLYADPLGRFSLVSFVWGPGQSTPIHDHTVWGLIGMLRGAEVERHFTLAPGQPPAPGGSTRLEPGMVGAVSPDIGDVHQVANAHADRTSISIHLYGADIGAVRRHVFDPTTGAPKDFVSGYANRHLPNWWGAAA